MNSKGLRDPVQREMQVPEEQFTFVQPGDIELGMMGNSQILNIRVSKTTGYGVNDIVKLLPNKAGSRLVVAGKIREIEGPVECAGEYVNVVIERERPGDLEIPIPERELGEGVYIDEPHRVTPEEQQLRIELGLARVIPYLTDIAPNPPIHNGFSGGALDADNDGFIENEEARKFAEGAVNWIGGEEGLKFSELAKGIPAWLKVTDIQLNPPQRVYIDRIFNGVSLQVRRQDIAEWLDIPAGQLQRNQITGTEFDSGTGDVGSVDLKATLEEARSEFQDLVRQLGDAREIEPQLGEPLTGLPWNRPTCYITVIGKKEGDLVVSRREVETIKKIKKCGKCFYRIVLTDDGVVSGIRSGKIIDCIFKLTMFQPLYEPIG